MKCFICLGVWLCILRAPQPRVHFLNVLARRCVYFIIENPLNSFLYHHGLFKSGLKKLKAARALTYLGAFEALSEKPLELFHAITSFPVGAKFDNFLVRSRAQARRALGTDKLALHKTTARKKSEGQENKTGWRSNEWVTASKDQKSSEEYPWAFAECVAGLASDLLDEQPRKYCKID